MFPVKVQKRRKRLSSTLIVQQRQILRYSDDDTKTVQCQPQERAGSRTGSHVVGFSASYIPAAFLCGIAEKIKQAKGEI